MPHYYTTDNNLSSSLKILTANSNSFDCFQDADISKADYNNLTRLANVPLEQLVKDNPSLLVFPRDLGGNGDDIGKNPVFILSGSSDDLPKVKITTGNMMGFVGCGDTEISITSRFAQSYKEDFFLHYMLQKVMAINVFQMEHSTSRNNEMDFLFYVFPYVLKKALAQGVYKTYQTFNKNDAAVKGVIDVSRHIKDNIPFAGKIAYKSRERTTENFVMHLIRHTIEYIETKPCGVAILNSDKDILSCVQTVYEATRNYDICEREKVITKNIKPFCHPYYTNYKPLVTLCLLILRYQKLKYAAESKKVYGILFDGAWLWEEYLASILTKDPLNFIHAKNKTREKGINIYKGNMRYPDFYRGAQIKNAQKEQAHAIKDNFIIDAKYKRLAVKNISEEISAKFGHDDLHQLVTYMHILPAAKGALTYPNSIHAKLNDAGNETFFQLIASEQKELYGLGGKIFTIGFPVPQNAENIIVFCKIMRTIEIKTKGILNIVER